MKSHACAVAMEASKSLASRRFRLSQEAPWAANRLASRVRDQAPPTVEARPPAMAMRQGRARTASGSTSDTTRDDYGFVGPEVLVDFGGPFDQRPPARRD